MNDSQYTQYRDRIREHLIQRFTRSHEPHKRFARRGETREVLQEQTIIQLFATLEPFELSVSAIPSNAAIARTIALKIRGPDTSAEGSSGYCNVLATFIHARCDGVTIRAFGNELLKGSALPCDCNMPMAEEAWKTFGIDDGGLFWEHQYIFCPVILRSPDENLASELCPLPFVKEPEFLKSGGYGEVCNVEIEKGHLFDSKTGMHNAEPRHYARKLFTGYSQNARAKLDYEAEDSIIKKLIRSTKTHTNILVTRATLQQGNSYSLFFDLAKSSLWDYFTEESIFINSLEERRGLFSRTIGLAGGLAFLHDELIESSTFETYQCYHLDLKPDNILVFDSDGHDIWKISDFGISQIKRVQTGQVLSLNEIFTPKVAISHFKNSSSGISYPRYGDTYAAPEARDKGDRVTRKVDVWSLGCVITLVLTFMDSQATGIRDFQKSRQQDERNNDRFYDYAEPFKGMGSEPVLHGSVRDWLKTLVEQALNRNEHEGCVIEMVSELLQDRMLCPDQHQRIDAKQVEEELIQIYGSYKNDAKLQESRCEEINTHESASIAHAAKSVDKGHGTSGLLLSATSDTEYDFPGPSPNGIPIPTDRAIYSKIAQWFGGNVSTTLWVHSTSTLSQEEDLLDLVGHVKFQVDNNSYPILYFCNRDQTRVPTHAFLRTLNSQLARLEKSPQSTDRRSRKDLIGVTPDVDELYERFGSDTKPNTALMVDEFYQHLRSIKKDRTVMFGIFHNLSWLKDGTDDKPDLLCLILDALKEFQSMKPLKLLFTTIDGTRKGMKAMQDKIAFNDRLLLYGPYPLSQLQEHVGGP